MRVEESLKVLLLRVLKDEFGALSVARPLAHRLKVDSMKPEGLFRISLEGVSEGWQVPMSQFHFYHHSDDERASGPTRSDDPAQRNNLLQAREWIKRCIAAYEQSHSQ